MADLIWPPVSLLSHARVDRPGAIEPDLWQALAFIRAPLCDCCGIPMPDEIAAISRCPVCLASPPDHDRARAALVYDDLSRPLVLEMKHAGRQDGLGVFASWMAASLDPAILAARPLVLPVPTHWTRLAARGFNQAARLAAALARHASLDWSPDALMRHRRTGSQKGLTASGRDRNVRGAFTVVERWKPHLAGRAVLLVDDVYTTGATVNACSRTLKRAGSGPVTVVTLARVVKPQHLDL